MSSVHDSAVGTSPPPPSEGWAPTPYRTAIQRIDFDLHTSTTAPASSVFDPEDLPFRISELDDYDDDDDEDEDETPRLAPEPRSPLSPFSSPRRPVLSPITPSPLPFFNLVENRSPVIHHAAGMADDDGVLMQRGLPRHWLTHEPTKSRYGNKASGEHRGYRGTKSKVIPYDGFYLSPVRITGESNYTKLFFQRYQMAEQRRQLRRALRERERISIAFLIKMGRDMKADQEARRKTAEVERKKAAREKRAAAKREKALRDYVAILEAEAKAGPRQSARAGKGRRAA